MNIQRYKWPVIVAAGLHGALFLSTPDSSRGIPRTTEPKPPVLRIVPADELFQLPPDDDGSSSNDSPAAGSVAVARLPEKIAPLTDKAEFVTTVVDHPRVENPTGTLKDYVDGPEGPNVGSLTSAPGSIDFTKLDKLPRATAQISPEYPASMRRDGIAGSVTVAFEVDKTGRVLRAEAINYTRREFVEAALRAVRNWHFEPGKQNGRAVAFRMTVPIEFSLDHD